MSKVQNISAISFLTFAFIIGILVFARGFLLNRKVISERSGPCKFGPAWEGNNGSSPDCGTEGKSCSKHDGDELSAYLDWCQSSLGGSSNNNNRPKVIVLLVDALRFDFVKRMEYLSSLINGSNKGHESYSCLFKFLADPPTTTMQRLKALTTGTMPTFIDASANFNSYEVEEDSLIFQLHSNGRRLAFFGDDTWLSLYPRKYFTSRFVEAYPSFNAWDLDTVDAAVNESYHRVFSEGAEQDWDVLISHVLGVDHCGHRYGPNHPEMKRKLRETDELIRYIVDSMDGNTLLAIFGDHGMTETGDHGGDSREESESALIFLSKSNSGFGLRCPSDLGGGGVLEVSQVDIIPTLSTLIGIPIPFSSIGQLIPGFLPVELERVALAATATQINRYVSHYSGAASSSSSDAAENPGSSDNSMQARLEEAYSQLSIPFKSKSQTVFYSAASKYFKEVKSIARSTWTEFNVPLMNVGIVISALSLLALLLYLYFVSHFVEPAFALSSLVWLSLAYLPVLLQDFLFSNYSRLSGIMISTLVGLTAFVCTLGLKLVRAKRGSQLCGDGPTKNNNAKCQFGLSDPKAQMMERSEIIAILLYSFTCLAVFSNSFVINEGYILGSVLLVTVGSFLLCSRSSLATLGITTRDDTEDSKRIVKLPIVRKHFKCSWLSFLFLAIIIRIGHNFFRCREELQECREEFLLHKQLASLPSDWVVHKFIRYGIELVSLAVFVVIFRQWLLYREISVSSRPSALVARYIPTVLVVLGCTFRALQGLPFASAGSSHLHFLLEQLPLVFNFVAFGAILVVWVRPLCVVGRFQAHEVAGILPKSSSTKTSLESRNGSVVEEKRVRGMGEVEVEYPHVTSPLGDDLSHDVFSSTFLTVGVLVTLLLVQITSEGMSPAMTLNVYTAVCLVGVFRNAPNHSFDSWSAVVTWCLASQFLFYASGHQPVFSAIPWDAAFVTASSSESSGLGSSPENILSWILPGLSVLSNLYSAVIVLSVLLPLLVYWKADKDTPESLMGEEESKNAFVVCGKLLFLHGLKVLMCMLCGLWQRRHLMVWKIFAPKLIFEVVGFTVACGSSLLVLVLLSRIKYQQARSQAVFGRLLYPAVT